MTEKIIVIDFGSQHTHQIIKSVMNSGVYAERVDPPKYQDILRIKKAVERGEVKGIILSGGPASVRDKEAPKIGKTIFELGIPILGICYGMQLIAESLGGRVESIQQKEYGERKVALRHSSALFKGIASPAIVWASHGDSVVKMPDSFNLAALSWQGHLISAIADEERKIYGVQFHPEVHHTKCGSQILKNFLEICGCSFTWSLENFIDAAVSEIKNKVGPNKVAQLVSGGVDSVVTFALLNKALGQDRVVGFYVDNGLMRQEDEDNIDKISEYFGWSNILKIRVSSLFLNNLEWITDPEEKREIIGKLFYIARDYAIGLIQTAGGRLIYTAQGTIYPDVIESAKAGEQADKIKTHHNLVKDSTPELLIEPLKYLFKDEVRKVAQQLNFPREFIWRKPFPGPGLAIRTICSRHSFLGLEEKCITQKTLEQTRKIARNHGLKAWVLPSRSVGVQGDQRSYNLPAVIAPDQRSSPNIAFYKEIAREIVNTVSDINRVLCLIHPQKAQIDAFRLKEAYINAEGIWWSRKTAERIKFCRDIHSVIPEAIRKYRTHEKMHGRDNWAIDREIGEIWQIFPILLPVSPSGKGESVVIRAVASQDAMTAEACEFPHELLEKMAWEILNLSPYIQKMAWGIIHSLQIEAIFYDLTDKPPATIEWE